MIPIKRFNSRTPCGVRPNCTFGAWCCWRFQFTHPVRGATLRLMPLKVCRLVSIHAPRAGCDEKIEVREVRAGCFNSRTPCGVRPPRDGLRSWTISSFNSRTPCGVRPYTDPSFKATSKFQFTHPVRGATDTITSYDTIHTVSIHAPRAGCDVTYSAE